MAAKDVKFSANAREKMLRGVDIQEAIMRLATDSAPAETAEALA